MTEEPSNMLDKETRILADACSVRTEMQMLVREAAEPWAPGDSIKAAVDRASRNLGLPYRRVRSFWYAAADAWAHEADQVRAWNKRAKRQELQRLSARLQELQMQIGIADE